MKILGLETDIKKQSLLGNKISMPNIRVRENEPFDIAMRRFKRFVFSDTDIWHTYPIFRI